MIPKLFSAALVAVLAMLGIVVAEVGWVALAAYSALVLTALVLAVRRHGATTTHDDGRTCTCCTSTVFDPVTVVDKVEEEIR